MVSVSSDPMLSSRMEALVEGTIRQELSGRLAAKLNRGFGGCGSLFRFVSLNGDSALFLWRYFNFSALSPFLVQVGDSTFFLWSQRLNLARPLFRLCCQPWWATLLKRKQTKTNFHIQEIHCQCFVSGEYQLDHVFMPMPSRMPHEVSSEKVRVPFPIQDMII